MTFKYGDKIRLSHFAPNVWAYYDGPTSADYSYIKFSDTSKAYTVRTDTLLPFIEEEKPEPHPHAALIKQWADNISLKFQFKAYAEDGWMDCTKGNPPEWHPRREYRVKPITKSDWSVPLCILKLEGGGWILTENQPDNIKLTYDGETGKLKGVELV